MHHTRIISHTDIDRLLPAPPFPRRDSALLRAIITAALDAFYDGDESPDTIITTAVVNAWYEGHCEGEDTCTGCTHRGRLTPGEDREALYVLTQAYHADE